MDRNTAKERIKQQISCTEFLQRARKGGYICPFCGSGTHKNGTGALKLYTDTNTWKCYACGKNGDVIDLYTKITGADYNTALQELAARIGIDIDGKRTDAPQTPKKRATDGENTSTNDIIPLTAKTQQNEKESKTDYTDYYNECKKRLHAPEAQEYLQKRGISTATAQAFDIGFDPTADPANVPGAMGDKFKPYPAPRIIIPSNSYCYLGRRVDNGQKLKKVISKGSDHAIFNERALYNADETEVFITEGEFDALSVLEMGKAATALNSANNTDKLIKALQERPTDKTLILCIDNDSAGQTAQKKLASACKRLNITYITADISNGHKDPNEALTADPALFLTALNKAQAAARRAQAAKQKPDNTALYIDTAMQADIARQKAHKITTCFENLNEKAGGIYSGLYIIAANTSIGKTTFTLQLADGIAASGTDVLYFSLEQSKLELVSKSLARYAATLSPNREEAPTSLQIRRGEWRNIRAAETIKKYKNDIGDRINIIEGNFNCDVEYIKNETRSFANRNKCRPVVIVDYFQILQATADKRQTLRESIDYNATELKRLSRELDITIILISSVNRNSYYNHFTAAALKESGGIEYTADCIWGLQLETMQNQEFTSSTNGQDKRDQAYKEAIAETPRQIQLICVKNRYGISNFDCSFEYYPANDLFISKTELCAAATDQSEEWKTAESNFKI